MAKLVIVMNPEEVYNAFYGDPKVGEKYKVKECKNLISGYKYYLFDSNTAEGWGGNMNGNIKRFHGWRGTTNDVTTDALGVREIIKVTEYKNGNVRVLMSDDLCPELE